MADYSDLMDRFRAAYVKGEPGPLSECLGDGFEWHNHYFLADEPRPTGRVLRGIDEMVVELQWRKQNWTDVRFKGLVEHFAPQADHAVVHDLRGGIAARRSTTLRSISTPSMTAT